MEKPKDLQDSLAGIERKLTAFESQLEANRRQFELRLDALERGHLDQGETAFFSAGVVLLRINEATEKMAGAKSQSQVLAAYLEEATAMASRGILFLKEGEQYSKWQSIGFDLAQVGPISTQDQSGPVIRAASTKQVVVSGENLEEEFPWLSESGVSPRGSLCIPLVFGDTVPVVLYLDSSDELPVDFLELLTQLAVLILKNQYLQQLITPESNQGGKVAVEASVSPNPFGCSEKEEETPSSEEAEGNAEPEADTLIQEETRADSKQTLILPNDSVPAVQAPDSEPTAILPDHTVREKTEVDAEANRAVSECNLPAERENDPQSTVSPPELTSQEESTDPEPGPKPPRFSYKKVPSRSEEISIPSEDGESG